VHAGATSNYEVLFDLAPVPAYIFDDETLAFLEVNTATVERYGYSRDEFRRLSIADIRPAEDCPALHDVFRDRHHEPKYEAAWRHQTKAGEIFDVQIVSQPITYNGRAAHFVVATDVTDQRRLHARLRESHEQLRRLSARSRARREEDRTRLARELHDQLGQALAGIKIDLHWIGQHVSVESDPAKVRDKVDATMRLVDDTIWRVRRLSSQLRPPVLDKLGLVAAIEWETKEFERRAGVRTRLQAGTEHVVLDPGRATAVFRMVQEALTNVVTHAQATRITVDVREANGAVTVTVSDNGRGIPREQIVSLDSLGMLGMRERAALLGGVVEVRGNHPHGTVVSLSIPLAERRAAPRDEP
jgi:PAS domain S-box-containing protein